MSDRERTAIHLTLLRHGETITVDLAETGTLIPRSEARVDDAFLGDLTAEIERAAHGSRTDRTAAVARVGSLVHSHLLTEPVRRRLHDARDVDLYLRLDERLVHVPWELCHDGTDFLVGKVRIARQVITGQAIPPARLGSVGRDRLRVLLVADPTETLTHAASEVERLCGLLDEVPGVEVTLLAGRGVRRVGLLGALQAHDIVHFAGHSHYDPDEPARSGWRLADGILTAGDIARLHPPPVLVFSNSCEAAAGTAWDDGPTGRVFGLGSAFLLAGVANYVGSLWVVQDDESLAFATTCYRHLAAGRRLGDALQAARTAVAASHGPNAIGWASYVHYGDPALQPFVGVSPVSPTEATARPATRRDPARFDVSLGGPAVTPVSSGPTDAQRLVGREPEMARLETALAAARAGTLKVVFVSGPPGIGKSALLDGFVARVHAAGDAWVAHGDAVEQYGAGEAYLPLLAALGRLGRMPEARGFVDVLRRVAPTWFAQLPAIADAREGLGAPPAGSSRERMLRELAELFEVGTVERPLVLVLEDLHWSDRSTIEAIEYLARGRRPARLLVVGTYRPMEAMRGDHPLRAVTQELEAGRRSEDIRLGVLDPSAVTTYLRGRLGAVEIDERVTALVHARTDGHPLFVVNVVDFAVRESLVRTEHGRLALAGPAERLASGIPEGLRPMIERQIESLPEADQRALEAAAVAGAEFSIASIAAALEVDPDDLDDRCEGLAWRGHFLRAMGLEEWPDGTLAGRYAFVHALYRNVLYDRLAATRRARFHRRIGERKAGAWGAHAGEIAGELAAHFEEAHDIPQAITFHVRAGDLAVRRYADREAIEHFRRAQALLPRFRDGEGRASRELEVLLKLAAPLMATAGYAAPELEIIFDRAHALARAAATGPSHAPLLRGIMSFQQVRGQHLAAKAVGEEMLALCVGGDDPLALVQAHYGHGVTLFDLFEFDASVRHLRIALDAYDPSTHATHVAVYGGYDPGVGCHCWLGWLHWYRGAFDRAVEAAREGLALADRLRHPFSQSFASSVLGMLRLQRGELEEAAVLIERGLSVCDADGFHYQHAVLLGLRGWVELARGQVAEAIASIDASIAKQRETGAGVSMPGFYGLVAMARATSGDLPAARAAVDTGVAEAERTGQSLHLTTLYRTRAQLIVAMGGDHGEAEAWHRSGLALAQQAMAPALELEAATALAEHLVAVDRPAEAMTLLEPLVARVTEGADVTPVRRARDALAVARSRA